MRSDQYLLDFSSRANERCAKVLGLRSARLPVDGLSKGAVEGVIELLQRLTLLSRDIPDSLADDFSVDAQVSALAARIERRKSVSEKTIRNWTATAVALGVLSVTYNSQHYGGSRWNTYTVSFGAVMAILTGNIRSVHAVQPQGQNQASKPGGNGRKRAVTISDPGAESITAPISVLITNEVNHSPPTLSALPTEAELKTPEPVVVSDSTKNFPKTSDWTHSNRIRLVQTCVELGMSPDGARGAVAAAIGRELTHASACKLVERYRAQTAHTHMTVGWLHRWLSGRSRPEDRPRARDPRPARGDALTRQQVAAEALRASIIRRARAAGASEDVIREQCLHAGVEY